MSPRPKRAVVVGAGIAGLTAAARLAHLGYDTTVVERQLVPGGRAAQETWEGFTFDLGPTLLFMLDVYRSAFASWGGDFDREVPTVRLKPNYRLNFVDGTSLIISSVLAETIAALNALEAGAGDGLVPYLAESALAYELSMREFVGRPVRGFSEFLAPKKIAALVRSGAFHKLFPAAKRAFRTTQLATAFSLQSMYLGLSPFSSPALYRLLMFAELGQGIFFPLGGIGSLVRGLERAARQNGAAIRYGCEVTALNDEPSAVRSIETTTGRIPCDLLLLTADLPHAYATLLREPAHRSIKMRHTPSALLLYVALNEGYDDLLHHEFLMPADLRQTCDDIFRSGKMPADPAIYLAAPARTDRSFAPAGGEALYVLVPAPNLDGPTDWARDTEPLVASILERIERRRLPGLRSRIRFCRARTPLDFAQTLNASRGAAFGLSHDLRQIGPFRPDNRHRRLHNVYFAGASTRPATGLPMVTMGAMQTVDRIARELPLNA